MQIKFNTWFTALAVGVILLACQDHRIPSGSGQQFRIKRVSTFGLRDYHATLFTYSPDGRIATYVDYASSGLTSIPGHTVTLTYDGQGQLASAQGESIDNYPIRYTYQYDTKGNITAVKYFIDQDKSGSFKLAISYDLVYSSSRFPDMVTRRIYDGLGSSRQTTEEQYTYANGNVVSLYSSSVGALTSYTYSDKVNPLYGLLYGVPMPSLYSKNVTLDPTFVDTYDANGLLIKRFRSGGPAASQNDFTQTFEYEVY